MPDRGTPAAKPPRAKKAKPEAPKELVGVHNLSQGGLAAADRFGGLAAPSLAVVHHKHAFANFGDVTLLPSRHLVDPKVNPVFDADVYSPRQPRAKYRVNDKALKAVRDWLSPYAKQVSDRHYLDLEDKVRDGGHAEPLRDYDTNLAMKLAWLKEVKNRSPEKPTRTKRLQYSWAGEQPLKDFVAQHGPADDIEFGSDKHRKLSAAVKASMRSYADKLNAADTDDHSLGDNVYEEGIKQHFGADRSDDDAKDDSEDLVHFGKTGHILRDAADAGQTETDHHAFADNIDAEVKRLGEPEFEKWAHSKLRPVEGDAYLPKYSESGNHRKLPYDMTNVLKEMTKKIRGGEGFNYGPGSARAVGAKKFKDVDEMKRHTSRLVDDERMSEEKERINNRFGDIAGKIAKYHPAGDHFGQMDSLVSALGNSFRRGGSLRAELAKDGYRNVPDHLLSELHQFGRDLLAAPTQYFEAKLQRAVGLNEFEGAVVPHDAAPETLDTLRRHGITDVERYQREGADGGAESRRQAVERLARRRDLMLSEADCGLEELAKAVQEHSVRVRDLGGGDFGANVEDKYGIKYGQIWWSLRGRELHPFNVKVDPRFRGRGLGKKLFEAMYAHAAAHGAEEVHLPDHSTSASHAISSLARQHGFEYAPQERAAGSDGRNENVDGSYDFRYAATKHPMPKMPTRQSGSGDDLDESDMLKAEDLDKAISDIKPGAVRQGPKGLGHAWRFDYDHALSPEHRAAGLRLDVEDKPYPGSTANRRMLRAVVLGGAPGGPQMEAVGKEFPTGQVTATVWPSGMAGSNLSELRIGASDLAEPHRGQGLGRAMYSAVMAHALHHHGARKVIGIDHSTSANRVHASLAREHGHDYRAPENTMGVGPAGTPYDSRFGDYSYDIKAELAKAEPGPEAALILVTSGDGRILLGKRRDNNRWSLPGGHLDPGESAEDGAARELLEETGCEPASLTFLRTAAPNQPGGPVLHCFSASLQPGARPTNAGDPDQEFSRLEWVDCRDGLPGNVYDHLHGPDDDSNVVRAAFDLRKNEHSEWLDAGFAVLAKAWGHRTQRGDKPDPHVNYVDPDERAGAIGWRGPRQPRVGFDAPPDPNDVPSLPGHVYRGISGAEHDDIVRTGHIKSNQSACLRDGSEGTCFGHDFGTAEGYTNFGSTNPARLGRPNYVIEVQHGPEIKVDHRDGYSKALQPVPATRITRAWRYRTRQTPEEGTWGAQGFQPTQKSELAKADDSDSYATYKFPSEDEAEEFALNYHGLYEDDWKGIGVCSRTWPLDGKMGERVWVAVRSWNEDNQKTAENLAHEFGGHAADPLDDAIYDELRPEACRMAKAEVDPDRTEVQTLLRHPDPRERAMALKLSGVSEHDLGQGLLDPDDAVYAAAFAHPAAPLRVLAGHARDLAGNPIHHRHDDLLHDPRLEPDHVSAMHAAVQDDVDLPVGLRAARLAVVASHPAYRFRDRLVKHVGHAAVAGESLEKAQPSGVFWHGTPSGELVGAANGLHVGTREAAEQALTARIGHPVEGSWDGTREYGKTLLAGKKTLAARGIVPTGYSCMTAPDEDHYPTVMPKFGDGRPDSPSVLPTHKPDIFPVRITGEMSNTPWTPHKDFKANGYMRAAITRGSAKRGYYYVNDGEDAGSVSAVVPPGGAHLQRLDRDALGKSDDLAKHAGHDAVSSAALAPDLGAVDRYPTDASREEPLPHLVAARDHFLSHVAEQEPTYVTAGGDAPATGADPAMPKYPGWTAKVVHRAPDGAFMVKPYHHTSLIAQGWAEATSQALYHAAGLGDLHQHSFVAPYGGVPSTVIRLEHGQTVDRVPAEHTKSPDFERAARRIAVMDHLTDQRDRNPSNLLVGDDGRPMAIDNADAFGYRGRHNRLLGFPVKHPRTPEGRPDPAWAHSTGEDLASWWVPSRDAVRRTMADRLRLVADPKRRAAIAQGFERRAAALDRVAANPADPTWPDRLLEP